MNKFLVIVGLLVLVTVSSLSSLAEELTEDECVEKTVQYYKNYKGGLEQGLINDGNKWDAEFSGLFPNLSKVLDEDYEDYKGEKDYRGILQKLVKMSPFIEIPDERFQVCKGLIDYHRGIFKALPCFKNFKSTWKYTKLGQSLNESTEAAKVSKSIIMCIEPNLFDIRECFFNDLLNYYANYFEHMDQDLKAYGNVIDVKPSLFIDTESDLWKDEKKLKRYSLMIRPLPRPSGCDDLERHIDEEFNDLESCRYKFGDIKLPMLGLALDENEKAASVVNSLMACSMKEDLNQEEELNNGEELNH